MTESAAVNPTTIGDGGGAPPVPWAVSPVVRPFRPAAWASPGQQRQLGALVAVIVVLGSTVLSAIRGFAQAEDPAVTPGVVLVSAWFLLGTASVAALLGWRYGPAAVALERGRAVKTVIPMSLWAMVGGAFVTAIAMVVPIVVAGSESLSGLVATAVGAVVMTFVLAGIGIVALGWMFVTLMTLPLAFAWVAILRTIGWLATRRSSSSLDAS